MLLDDLEFTNGADTARLCWAGAARLGTRAEHVHGVLERLDLRTRSALRRGHEGFSQVCVAGRCGNGSPSICAGSWLTTRSLHSAGSEVFAEGRDPRARHSHNRLIESTRTRLPPRLCCCGTSAVDRLGIAKKPSSMVGGPRSGAYPQCRAPMSERRRRLRLRAVFWSRSYETCA